MSMKGTIRNMSGVWMVAAAACAAGKAPAGALLLTAPEKIVHVERTGRIAWENVTCQNSIASRTVRATQAPRSCSADERRGRFDIIFGKCECDAVK